MPWREGLAMNRQVIIAGLVVFGLLLFVFIVATMAAPGSKPVLDIPNNDSFDDAEPILVPANVTGVLTQTGPVGDSQDYYRITNATIGSSYQANLSILSSIAGMSAQMTLYHGNRNIISGPGTTISWQAVTTTYYILVESKPAITETAQTVSYRLRVDQLEPTSTPAPTNTPTNTPLPTSISTADPYEGSPNNNEFARAYVLPVTTYLKLSDYLGVATFHTLDPNRDVDWYAFWGKKDEWYQIETSGLSSVDTYVAIYKDNGTKKITSNDDGGGGYASLASFEASYDGYYYIKVTNKVNTVGSYNMVMEQIGEPTPGPTVTPGPGANSKVDPCEDNLDFDHACIIAANDPKKFNFVPPYGGVDNDYFKLRIKPGYNYKCFTSDLDAGVDPNMIVYDQNRNGIGGNDDVEPGDLNSSFSYYATYEGWLYILVGYGDRTPSDIYNSNYTLECQSEVPGEPTAVPAATSGPAAATSTPRPSAAPPTATPFVGLKIRPLTTPTPVPETPSEPIVVPINLLVYYDANGDGQPGAGEGIAGISAQAYDASTNTLLAQGVTDAQGHLEFTVTAQGPVRVSVPFFGFSQLVTEETTIRLRVLSLARP
jgi:hypothetical protein